MNEDIKNFIDDEGKINTWPSKMAKKLAVLSYISEKFEVGREYTEKEVNEVINKWHTFGDYFILRRGLVDYQLLKRTRDGSKYWKGEREAVIPDDPKCLCAVLRVEDEQEK